ncbi:MULTISPECIES: pyridoxamine 5'-phosphate oxidase family protein [unclassified Ekhidna]|jgi:nitroimidazol reductase NimA-like FMN-containing flavoprotein (pyridoxamine 5'-phosphate oxidase superfamily)|uniref:pyridoxamine 5'-phosphate oxidase family protein n=1 Tax=unclassified Ekhidna TaxID=2632188 RepID=UPI0032DEEAFE
MRKTKPSRYPSRGTQDKETLYRIIDEGLFCTIAFNRDGVPHQIPTGFARVGNDIYIHASAKSAFMDTINGQEVSYSITHLDALVLSPTAFDHSFNYRSVIGFSKVEEITDPKEKLKFFNVFTDRYIPGRIADIGEPTPEQVSITKIARISLENAAAKVRTGGVNMKMDKNSAWCGVIPVKHSYGAPIIDEQLGNDRELPEYLKTLTDGSGKP